MKKQLVQIMVFSMAIQVCLAVDKPMPKGYTIPTFDPAKTRC